MELTREQIETMEAGPELDAAVAEYVMGWYIGDTRWTGRGVQRHSYGIWYQSNPKYCRETGRNDQDWKPSTDIAAAWEVLKHIGLAALVGYRWGLPGKLGMCTLDDGHGWQISVLAKTEELAICRAALSWALEREQSK